METSLTIGTLEDLAVAAKRVLSHLTASPSRATVVGLMGDLGAGKTAFVQCLARELGIEESVTSPTYLIMRSYESPHPDFIKLVHMDAYRIESEEELGPIRFPEILASPRTLVCIEWIERIMPAVPVVDVSLSFTLNADGTRLLVVKE